MTTVLCYGDSNTYGWLAESAPHPSYEVKRQPADVRWTGRLQMLLGPDYKVIEEGCSGRTTIFDDPLEGWKNGLLSLKPILYSHKPFDILILMLGTNDLKQYFCNSATRIAAGAGVLVDTAKEFCTLKQGFIPKIILVAPPRVGREIQRSPFYGEFDETAVTRSYEFSEAFRKIADSKGCLFVDAAVLSNADEFVDQVHLNPAGHAALAQALAELIKGSSDR